MLQTGVLTLCEICEIGKEKIIPHLKGVAYENFFLIFLTSKNFFQYFFLVVNFLEWLNTYFFIVCS